MLPKDGKNVGGLLQMNSEDSKQGITPHWTSYLAVEDVKDATAKLAAAGGTVTMPPMDVLDVDRTAWAQDSAGTAFAPRRPMSHIGAAVTNEPTALRCDDLSCFRPPRTDHGVALVSNTWRYKTFINPETTGKTTQALLADLLADFA